PRTSTPRHNLGIGVRPDGGRLASVVDMAQIRAFQERPAIEADPARACRDLADGIRVRLDGRRLIATPTTDRLAFPPGQGGLDTLRLECGYRAELGTRASSPVLDVEDLNHADRLGWREIVARGGGTALGTTLPSGRGPARLTVYPQSLVASPLDVRPGAAPGMLPTRDALPI